MDTRGFPPIYSPDAQVLILGSLPGTESIRLQHYYGHARNQFWMILSQLLEEDLPLEYAPRVEMLHRHRIALWDVLHRSERKGSLDSAIQRGSEQPNDVGALLDRCPDIRCIALNGQKALGLFNRFVDQKWKGRSDRAIDIVRLPSTSPAYAGMSLEMKLQKWSVIKKYLHDEPCR